MIPKKALNLVGQDYQCYKGKFSHLTRLDISIFEVLISCGGANRRHLSNVLNRSQSQISKRLKIWKKLGVISQIGLNPKVAYIKKSFHSDVKRLLEAYRFGKNNAVYSVHNLFFITEINEIPEKLRRHLLKNGWNSRNRKNVPSIITEVEGVTVIFEKASHSWKAQFLTKCLGETPAITFDLAIQKVNTVKDKLRYKYPGLKFGGREDFMTLHRLHVAFLLEPFTAKMKGISNFDLKSLFIF